jgi:thymidylate synthase
LNPEVRDFYRFTVEDVIVESYEANPQIKQIPVAV